MAIEDISHGLRRLSLAVAQLFLEELSRPFSHWIIRTPTVQAQATALDRHALPLELCQPSSPWEVEAVSQHTMEFVLPVINTQNDMYSLELCTAVLQIDSGRGKCSRFTN